VFDREGNGTLNKEELRLIVVALGDKVVPEELDIMLRDADVNGAGLLSSMPFVRLLLFK
jgi:Ca2+-binding EF-hand superfamily protein